MNYGPRGGDGSGGGVVGENGPDDALARSKRALERARAARRNLEDAARAVSSIEGQRFLLRHLASSLGGEHRFPVPLPKDLDEGLEEAESALRDARATEDAALDEFGRATEELLDATVQPRVEGMKLRFETSRLQATLSAGVLLGAATLTELLLPPDPGHVFVMWAAYGVLLSSLSGGVSDMRKISIYVENLLTGGRTEVEEPGWREEVARATTWVNQRSLTLGLALFALFVALNLA